MRALCDFGLFFSYLMSGMLDLQEFQGFDLAMKVFMVLHLWSIFQTRCVEAGTCTYISFNKSLDIMSKRSKKTGLICDCIFLWFV